jgi:hypothetical protein
MKKIEVTQREITAIDLVEQQAIENSCSCSDFSMRQPRGYLGHRTGCWVHINRAAYKKVNMFLRKARRALTEESRG